MINKLLWVFIEKGGITLLQFATLIILGRILTPIDYGVYGIMMIVIAVSDMLVDSGFGGALVYKKKIEQLDINTLFIVNITISLVLYVAIIVFSPLLERYYKIDNLSLYLRVLGSTIIFFALSQVQNALVIRNLEFKKSAIINILAVVLSSLIAIILANKGYGVWSLIIQSITNSLLVSFFLWVTSKTKINIAFSRQSLKFLWGFGSNLLFANILQTIVNNISTSIIPKIGSVTQSGHFFQASKLSNIPINIITVSIDKFSFPILTKEREIISLKYKARNINRFFFLFFAPLFPLLSYTSKPLISLILGSKWEPVSVYFSLLCWSGIGLLIQCLYRNFLKSLGRTRYIMYVEIIKSILTLAGLFICACFGVKYLVVCIVFMSYIGAIIWGFCIKKQLNLTYHEQIMDILKPLLSLSCTYLLLQMIPISNDSYFRFVLGMLSYFVYLSLNYIMKQDDLVILYNKYSAKIFKK